MDPKKVFFLVATAATASAVAASYGTSVTMRGPVTGAVQVVEWDDYLRPSPAIIVSQIESLIASQYCPEIDAAYGSGACVPTGIDYIVRHSRKRGNTRSVVRFEQYGKKDIRRPTPAGIVSQLESQIQNRYCPLIDAQYSDGTCDASAIDYEIIHARKNGNTRSVASFGVPVFCGAVPPPTGDGDPGF
jgi:hypothetical protein